MASAAVAQMNPVVAVGPAAKRDSVPKDPADKSIEPAVNADPAVNEDSTEHQDPIIKHGHHHHHKRRGTTQQEQKVQIDDLQRVGSKKLIDILKPREPLPVILPPISDIRRKNFKDKQTKTSFHSRKSRDNAVPFVVGDDAPNPFQYPTSIEEIVAQNELEKAEKRREEADIPPLMRGTNLYKQNQTVLARIKPFLQPAFKPSLAHDYKQVVWKAQNGLHINHLQKISRKMHTEYILQRKNIYYLRRAVRARKIALEMVQRTREFEEACLKDYEWLTDFTEQTFEQFLKMNHDETHNAARMAENALKEKLEKTLEVRQLNIKINQMKTDIISTNDSLRECKMYMKFLDDIAREIMRKDEEEQIRAMHRENQIKEELSAFLKLGMTLEEAEMLVEKKAKEFIEDQWQLAKHRDSLGSGSADFVANLHKQIREHLGIPEPTEVEEAPQLSIEPSNVDSMISTISAQVYRGPGQIAKHVQHEVVPAIVAPPPIPDEAVNRESLIDDEDGYNEKSLLTSLDLVPGNEATDRVELASLSFTRPSQLLQIYSDMEEANLSLIQHSQASEELLERVNHEISKTRKALNRRGRLLRDEINNMQTNIDTNEERANALTMLVEMFTGGNYDVRQQQRLYKVLQRHVAKVYKTAVGTIDHHLNPIMMLTSIEKNFENLMQEIQAMPTDVVVQISRELDKERREEERLEKINQRKAVQEERKSRAMVRAKAPIPRRKGRPLLARSHPPKIVIHLSQAELDKKAEEDEFNYFFGP